MYSRISSFYSDGIRYYCIEAREDMSSKWEFVPNSESTNLSDVMGLFIYYNVCLGLYELN